MRREKQALSEAEATEILIEGSYGVLGVTGERGYPYTVPLNYAYAGGKLVFHCATEGQKIDFICQNEKASFCVVTKSQVLSRKFATNYRSAIVFGRVKIVAEPEEKRQALQYLVEKYAPDDQAEGRREIEAYLPTVCILEMTMDEVTGKAASKSVQDAAAALTQA